MSEHDRDLVDDLRADTGSRQVEADDPESVARELVDSLAAEIVDADQLADTVAAHRRAALGAGERAELRELAGRVSRAEEVVAGADGAERARVAALLEPDARPRSGEPDEAGAGAAADRQAIRFALVILVLAQVGGLAVFVADGDRYAAALPAGALLALGAVVAFHRWPRHPRSASAAAAPVTTGPVAAPSALVAVDRSASPTVRAAEAHLRRQRAAWKVAWWARGLPVPPVASWEPDEGATDPVTLVHLDHGAGGAPLTEPMALPATVRVVVVSPRTA